MTQPDIFDYHMDLQGRLLRERLEKAPRNMKPAWRKALRDHTTKMLSLSPLRGDSLPSSRFLAGGALPDSAPPAPFSQGTHAPGEYLTGEGPYRLKGVDWKAIADGRAL